MKFSASFFAAIAFILFAFYGCKEQPAPPAKTAKPKAEAAAKTEPAAGQTPVAAQETPPEEGYVYQPGDRRDPFVPLIVTTKKTARKTAGRPGTLESYDIGEFTLLAVAKKGDQYYALLVTPDNRSFSVKRGTVIGYNNGKVEEITKNKVVLVEYSKDFKGDLQPKRITLEFQKER
ncbi:MAG: pilus assembly protein PilP [Nitrospirae bacterium]|nr:pilus assembly protein PilP [Nitrospirota bacterium]